MSDDLVLLGKLGAAWGVNGWIRVWSYTADPENLLNYKTFIARCGDKIEKLSLLEGRSQGRSLVALFEGLTDRKLADQWTGCEIGILREELPALKADEFYWVDLVGLRVVNVDGRDFGQVESLIGTGANDVLVVVDEETVYIPFLMGSVILEVNLEGGFIQVDWSG